MLPICDVLDDGPIGFPILFSLVKAADGVGKATSQSSLRMELKSLPPYLDAQQNQFDLAIPLVVENWGEKKRVSLRGHWFDPELCENLAKRFDKWGERIFVAPLSILPLRAWIGAMIRFVLLFLSWISWWVCFLISPEMLIRGDWMNY